MIIMNFRDRLSDQDYLDGDIGGPAQKIGYDLANENQFITISDQDHEIFYYDTKGMIWRPNGEDLIWRWIAKRYPALSQRMLKEVVHFVQGQTLKRREKFQPQEGILSFANYSVDAVHNYAVEMDAPDLYIRNRFPVKINKKATCPKFSRFLNEIIPEVEDRATLLECMSMVLVPQFNFEKAVMLIGKSAANGKSTIIKIMKVLFGVENTISISLQDMVYNRFMAQKLDGKLLNLYADINNKEISDLGKFKLFVSGDLVTVERKHGHPYEIVPKTIHFFSTNTLPEIKEDNNAVYRRFVIIDFPVSFEDRKDLNLLEKLTTAEELEGIMWLLLRTAQRLARKKQFTYPQTPNEVRMRWKLESNAVYELIEHSNFIIIKSDKEISRSKFYECYIKFCMKNHYTIKSQSTVSRQVAALGYATKQVKGERYWFGVGEPNVSDGQTNL